MKRRPLHLFWVAAASFMVAARGAACLGAEAAQRDPSGAGSPVDFTRDVAPVFEKSCSRCHNPVKRKGGLSLTHYAEALAGGDSGPAFVAGKSSDSRLIKYVSGLDPDEIMPPQGDRLTAEQIHLLRAWIDQGAAGDGNIEKRPPHWAFQPISHPPVPKVKKARWVRNPIDAFILSKLEAKRLAPSPEAGRPQLIRRLKLDLLGLPPTPAEVTAFLNDKSSAAYERLVDSYLASPHYGERWGRHWLDLARFADSAGYESDYPRSAWRYRDWVINAFNQNLPYDQFVVDQLAGDLLPNATDAQRIATGFHANNMFDPLQRWESIIDRVNTTGTVFLGLTVGCAQCHNHKTDPLTNREYYELYAFFNQADTTNLNVQTAEEKEKRRGMDEKLAGLEKQLAAVETALSNGLPAWETNLNAAELAKLPFTVQSSLKKTASSRSDEEKEAILSARLAQDKKQVDLAASVGELRGQIAGLPIVPVLTASPHETHIFLRGVADNEGDAVTPGAPAFLPPMTKTNALNRLDLARWLVAPENPLLARVEMNRVWMRYFGTGLVETENDFGVKTPPPSHPELLDWLASEFRNNGWDLKAMQRLIVCSATYRQSSAARPDAEPEDPQDRFLSRQRRLRLDAEIIRDESLYVGDLLSPKIGGASVFPYQPPGILEFRATKAEWIPSTGEDQHRRSLYTWFWRLTPHPYPTLFDAPDALTTCTRRNRSDTPVQALTLLNDPVFNECAHALATRVLKDEEPAPKKQVREMVQICLGRQPTKPEQSLLLDLLAEQRADFAARLDDARKIAGRECPAGTEPARYAAWVVVARTVLNLDEFLTRE
ncbi:MAG TPA: PSD1 and planctomycete cytochrome C domain-containing protein [Verrucomicrobiae bacterium]|jgi:mono/diheme cytochrome c family protein|nr:PSD1 and planctomycete cytochrome C domain-containing protein [Verrucomicrobiae bacterium]